MTSGSKSVDELRSKSLERSEAARLLAAQREVVSGTCEVCGKEFTGTKKRRYCSSRCALRGWRAAQREKEAEAGK